MITYDDLTDGQKSAFDNTMEAIKNKKGHITINGPAGTGKTTLTKFIIDHLIKTGEAGIILCAPTHQAKKVLSKLSGMDASTIHSVLKINPTTYEENQIFEQREVPDLAACRVLICDEASFYDRKLFGIILATVPSWCTVIALGDKDQLRPVTPGESEQQLSPFFSHAKFKQVHLTEIKRSNGPIIQVATDIRNGGWLSENIVDGEGVHAFNSNTALKDFMIRYFDVVKTADDLIESRMLAYTNKSVDKLNGIIRRKLYETDKPFINGEVLVMQEPLMKELEFDGKKFHEIVFNNGQLVKILYASETSTFISARNVPGEYMIRYWNLEVETADSDDDYATSQIQVICDPAEMTKFQMFLAKTADTYKNSGVKAYWKDFWSVKNKFKKVKALPVSTIHKSQGCTVNNTFLYTPCIHMADAQLAKQLLYVGATRARTNLYYI
ncbi:DNA helicase, phage-associated [Yersinia phage phiR1-RT]|uniref:DNA helicase, phage-associated n=1 Tax=Yersinia phage phiR1-RT TaxID=1206558 RepID=I7J3V8_BPPR1|nr:Dda-like helicase [Yersinia phage phiR1-RT]CCI88598.1 DNA helicase, phage-associated [Yersinia phage phiR1-RT]